MPTRQPRRRSLGVTTGTPLFVPALAGAAVVPAAHLWGGLAGLAAGLLPPALASSSRNLY